MSQRSQRVVSSRRTASDERLWSIEDVATYLGVPKSSVYKMTSLKGRSPIPHFKLGRRLRFRKGDIDRWLEVWGVSPTEMLSRTKTAVRGSS